MAAIQFQSGNNPNLDQAAVLLHNAYANQQANLGGLVKVGTDFANTAQKNNDTKIKEYLYGLNISDLANRDLVQQGIQNALPTNDLFGYNRATALDLYEKRPTELNQKVRDNNLTTRDINLTQLDNQKTAESKQTYDSTQLAKTYQLGDMLSRSKNPSERVIGYNLLNDVDKALRESPAPLYYDTQNIITGLSTTEANNQFGLSSARDKLFNFNIGKITDSLLGAGVKFPTDGTPMSEDEIKYATGVFKKYAPIFKKQYGIDITDPEVQQKIRATGINTLTGLQSKQLDVAGKIDSNNKTKTETWAIPYKINIEQQQVDQQGEHYDNQDNLNAWKAINGITGNGNGSGNNNNKDKPSAQYTAMNSILEAVGIKGGITQNLDGTFTYNKDSIRGQISNAIDQAYIVNRPKPTGNAKTEALNGDYAGSGSLFGTMDNRGQDMANYLKGYTYKGKPLLADQEEYLWNQLGTGLRINELTTLGDDGKDAFRKNATKLLDEYENSIKNKVNSSELPSKLGNMITGIAVATNKTPGSVIIELGLEDPKILEIMPEGIKSDYAKFKSNQLQGKKYVEDNFSRSASNKRLYDPNNKSSRAQRMQNLAKRVNGKKPNNRNGYTSKEVTKTPLDKVKPTITAPVNITTNSIWQRIPQSNKDKWK